MSRPRLVLGAAVAALAVAAAPAPGADQGFTARVTNPYYPLLPGMRWEYRGVKDGRPLRDVVLVTKRIERIGGVPCAVVFDRGYVDGRLAESTIDWFAQDAKGTLGGVGDEPVLLLDAVPDAVEHELRTPLAAMRCEIDVSLRADDLPPAARQVLESAREEVDRMTRTVDDLLVLASLDEGRLELVVEPLDLHVVVARAVASLDPLARTRGVSLGVDGSAAMALGDAARLGQAVRNLVENAIKFSPEGGEVVVTTWAADGEVGVTVRDQGPGVALEVRERIFDRFFRADPSRLLARARRALTAVPRAR